MNVGSLVRTADISTLSAFLLLLFGPLPVAVAGAWSTMFLRRQPELFWSVISLIVTLYWVACQLMLATVLAGVGYFTLPAALVGEGLLLITGGVWVRQVTNHRRWHGGTAAEMPSMPSPLLWLSLCLIALLLLGNLVVQPVTDYDSLYYHLPFMANLHATGQLTAQSVAPVVAWYPYGWEALCTLFLLPTDSDIFVAIPNLIAWGVFGIGAYVVARRLGAMRSAALAAVLCLLTLPLVLDQLNSLRIDLALAALFMAGVAVVTMALPRGDAVVATAEERNEFPVYFLLMLLVMALLPAIKTSGIVYSALLILFWLLGNWWAGHPILPLRQRPPWLPTLLLSAVVATTSFWYLRNWFIYANPLGTVEVRVGAWLLFPGSTTSATVQQTTLATLFQFTDPLHRQLYLTQIWQQGNLALLGLALFALLTLFQLFRAPAHRTLLAVLGGTALLLLLYWTTPYSGDDGSFGYQLNGPWVGQAMRFALPALGMLAVLAALGASGMMKSTYGEPLVVGVALTLALATVAQRSTLYLLASIFIVLLMPVYGLLRKRLWRQVQPTWLQHRELIVALSVLTVALLFIGFPVVEDLRQQRRLQAYGTLPTLVDELTVPGATVAALHSHQSYLANGQTLRRQVVQMPTHFADPPALQSWLRDNEITLLIVGPLRPEWQNNPALDWLDAPDAPYALRYDGFPDHPRLYSVQVE
ncbi:MAG: hypothetical protein KDE19_12460 [Caldilineaceae bacterium]|nr:hypothetical protein [Caldilineaceae bacterium]